MSNRFLYRGQRPTKTVQLRTDHFGSEAAAAIGTYQSWDLIEGRHWTVWVLFKAASRVEQSPVSQLHAFVLLILALQDGEGRC